MCGLIPTRSSTGAHRRTAAGPLVHASYRLTAVDWKPLSRSSSGRGPAKRPTSVRINNHCYFTGQMPTRAVTKSMTSSVFRTLWRFPCSPARENAFPRPPFSHSEATLAMTCVMNGTERRHCLDRQDSVRWPTEHAATKCHMLLYDGQNTVRGTPPSITRACRPVLPKRR